MRKLKKNQKGFIGIEVIIIALVIVALIAGAGYLVSKNQKTSKLSNTHPVGTTNSTAEDTDDKNDPAKESSGPKYDTERGTIIRPVNGELILDRLGIKVRLDETLQKLEYRDDDGSLAIWSTDLSAERLNICGKFYDYPKGKDYIGGIFRGEGSSQSYSGPRELLKQFDQFFIIGESPSGPDLCAQQPGYDAYIAKKVAVYEKISDAFRNSTLIK